MRIDETPLLVIWEATQACDLACVHCRASATPRRHSSELSTEEACRLLETVKIFGDPLMVFTGGDPLKRPDILPLLGRSVALGLRTNINPSATSLLTKEKVQEFRECGVARMAIGLDGPDAETHDGFRGMPGTFDRAIEALEEAQRIGLETQLRTTVTRRNMHRLDDIAGLAAKTGTRMWSVLFLMNTGRAPAADALDAEESRTAAEKMQRIAGIAPFEVRTAEANHLHHRAEHADLSQTARCRNDGGGVVFISYTGEIYPSASLPITAGNVRFDSLVKVYRNSSLFRELRGGQRGHGFTFAGNNPAADPPGIYLPSAGADRATAGVRQEA